MHQLSLSEVHNLANRALVASGFSKDQAEAIATIVSAAERDDCKSHGLFRIPFYVKALQNTDCNAQAKPSVTLTTAAIVHVDAHSGFCPLAIQRGIEPLMQKARTNGIAALAVHNAYNIAALWPEVEQLAESGFVAFAFTAANAYVAPAGGSKPVYGTNPMAFSWPREGKPPLVFDQASSASARGEIQLHLRDGKQLPIGWAIDADGQPTTDPEEALAGAQLPFGGHKGAALALMIELLAGALIGDLFSYESSERDIHQVGAPFGGEFIIALEPTHFAQGANPQKQFERAEMLFTQILSQSGTRLPSDRRYHARIRNLENGVDIPVSLYNEIQLLAEST